MARTGPSLASRLARAFSAAAREANSPVLRSVDAFITQFYGSGLGWGSYKGARIHRGNSDWPTRPRSIRQELEPALMGLRARARDLSKNNPYARSFLDLLDTNVIGPEGIQVRARVRLPSGDLDVKVNRLIDEAWDDWASSPVTADRKLDFRDALALILETWATDGEELIYHIHGAPNPYGYALQMIDADMLDERFHRAREDGSNEIRMSVEIDEYGAEVAYHVREGVDAYTYPFGGTRRRLVAWDPFTRKGEVIHPHLMHRISQTRGVSWFHAVMEKMDHVEGYNEAALYGAKQNAASTMLITPGDDTPDDVVNKEATPIEEIVLEPAAAYRLRKGDEVSTWEPKQAALASLPAFLKEMGRQMAIGLGVQYYALAHDLESTSFSSMRGGEALMRPLFRVMQRRLISRVVRPVREAWLKNAILSGRLRLPSIDPTRYLPARYKGRGWTGVNPWEDARADALKVMMGLTSRTRILAEASQDDIDDILDELEEEQAAAEARGIDITPPSGIAGIIQEDPPESEGASPKAKADPEAPAAPAAAASSNGNGKGSKQGKDAAVPETRGPRWAPSRGGHGRKS